MTTLVTGASGFLGAAVVRALHARGETVVRGVRTARAADEVALGDLSATTDWRRALAGVDAVIHCAARAHVLREAAGDPQAAFDAVNCDATLSLARAAIAAGVRRLVFVSSIGVNGAATLGTPFGAGDTPAPQTPYARSKAAAEAGLKQLAGLDIVIVRPPLVIGPGSKGNLGSVRALVARGVPLPFGAIVRNRRDLVSLGVLADLLVTCVAHPVASGQTFLVSDGVTRSTADIVRAVARAEGMTARMLPVPPALIGAGLRALRRQAMADQLIGDLEIDMHATCEMLGWTPSREAIF